MTGYTPYVGDLKEAKEDEAKCVWVGDGHHRGTTLFHAHGRWYAADLENNQLQHADEIAVVRLDDSADPDNGLNQSAIAFDLDGDGLYVVPAEFVDDNDDEGYGDALEVVWRSDEEDEEAE